MKKTIMLTALLVITITFAFSQKKEFGSTAVEKIIPIVAFDQLTIDGSFKLTLIESDEPYIYIKGSAGFIKAFTAHYMHNNLLVSSFYKRNPAGNNQVIIPVKNLKKLVVKQNASIDAIRMIMPDDFVVMLEAECIIRVNKTDQHKIETTDNLMLEVLPDLRRY